METISCHFLLKISGTNLSKNTFLNPIMFEQFWNKKKTGKNANECASAASSVDSLLSLWEISGTVFIEILNQEHQ